MPPMTIVLAHTVAESITTDMSKRAAYRIAGSTASSESSRTILARQWIILVGVNYSRQNFVDHLSVVDLQPFAAGHFQLAAVEA